MLRTDSETLFVSEINDTFYKTSLFILKLLRYHSCLFTVVLNAADRSAAIFQTLANLFSPGSQRLSMQIFFFFKKNKTLEMRRANHGSKMMCIIFIFFLYPWIAVIQYGIQRSFWLTLFIIKRSMILGNEAWTVYNSTHPLQCNLQSIYRKKNESTVIIPDAWNFHSWDQTMAVNEKSRSHSHAVPLWE